MDPRWNRERSPMPDVGLLTPGLDLIPGSAAAATDDIAVLRHLLAVESAWLRAQAAHGQVTDKHAAALTSLIDRMAADNSDALDLAVTVARESAGGGNPVIPLLVRIRATL